MMGPNFSGQVLSHFGVSIQFDLVEEFHFCFSLCWVLAHFHSSQAFFLVLDCSLNFFQELLIHLEVDWQSIMGPNFSGPVLNHLGVSIEFDLEEEFHFCFSPSWTKSQ